ncbi:MAG: hypothetical protein ACK58L_01365 [Planctomycetota bacterium]
MHRISILFQLSWLIALSGCGDSASVIGLKATQAPPMKVVEGPGFTIQIPEDWSSENDGSKLIVTAPPEECRCRFVVEVQPYQMGETSDNLFEPEKKRRKTLRNADHQLGELSGMPYYRCLYARNPKEQLFDSGTYLVAYPGRKVIGTIEWGSMKDVISSLVPIELSMMSVTVR